MQVLNYPSSVHLYQDGDAEVLHDAWALQFKR